MADRRNWAATALLMLCLIPANPSIAAPHAGAGPVKVPHGTTRCNVGAWVSFRAEAPIPVRAGPTSAARLLGELPIAPETEGDVSAIEFDIIEARPGWLKIDHATNPVELNEEGEAVPARPLPAGEGWIPDDAAPIGIQSALGYADPDAASPLLLDIGDDWVTDMGWTGAIRGCSGDWLLVDYQIERARTPTGALVDLPEAERPRGTAWFRGICANQKTTCDMASVDRRP